MLLSYIEAGILKWCIENIDNAFSNWLLFNKQGAILLQLLKTYFTMSRIKRLQNIDNLVSNLQIIAKSQCSLSESDVNLLNDAIAKLNRLRTKKGLTDKHYQIEISEIVELLYKFLV